MNVATRLTPSQALEYQDQLDRFTVSRDGIKFWRGWYRERVKAGYPLQAANGNAEVRALRESDTLRQGETYFISNEMVELAMHAARSMPDQVIVDTDLPFPKGFVVFESPIVMRDIRGVMVNVIAFSWTKTYMCIQGPEGFYEVTGVNHDSFEILPPTAEQPPLDHGAPVISITDYSDIDDPRDEYLGPLRQNEGKSFPSRFVLLSESILVPGQKGMNVAKYAAKHGVTEDVVRESTLLSEKLPLALWALLQQKLPQERVALAERHTRRRLERSGSRFSHRSIRLITLRKPESRRYNVGGGEPIDWQHRWIVSGHWRNVWHASIGIHRLQWIAPFMKGPDDKPLLVKPTVRQLIR